MNCYTACFVISHFIVMAWPYINHKIYLLKFSCLLFYQALADPYFKGLSKVEREPSCQPISKMEFEFERRRVTKEDIRELIFREILEYHPQLLKDYMNGTERTNFLYPRLWLSQSLFIFDIKNMTCFLSLFHPDFWSYFINSAVDQFRKQFAHLEENGGKSVPVIPPERKHVSLPR